MNNAYEKLEKIIKLPILRAVF